MYDTKYEKDNRYAVHGEQRLESTIESLLPPCSSCPVRKVPELPGLPGLPELPLYRYIGRSTLVPLTGLYRYTIIDS